MVGRVGGRKPQALVDRSNESAAREEKNLN
jgi:hypothetical protein